MKRIILSLCISYVCTLTYGQTVDITRLGYDLENLSSQQASLSVSPNGTLIAIAYEDSTIQIFDISVNKFVKSLKNPVANIFDMTITNDSRLVICNDHEVKIINWKTGEQLGAFLLDDEIVRLAYSGSANLVALAQDNSLITMIDLSNPKEKSEFKSPRNGYISSIAIHPGGKEIAFSVMRQGLMTGGEKKNLRVEIYDREKKTTTGSTSFAGYFMFAEYDSTGNTLLIGGNGLSNQNVFISKLDSKTLQGSQWYWPFSMKEGFFVSGASYRDKAFITTQANSFIAFDYPERDAATRIFTTLKDSRHFSKETTKRSGLRVRSVNQIYSLGKGRFLFNWHFSNVSQIYNATTNSIESYFFSDSNGDFAVVAKDGKIDGTPGGIGKLYWTSRKSNKTTPLESTFEKNFSPKLLSTMVNKSTAEPDSKTFEMDDVVAKIPEVTIKAINGKSLSNATAETTQKNIKVEVVIGSNAAEITELKMFHNAKFIKRIIGTGASKYEFDITLNNAYGENNYIYVQAGSKSGVDSKKSTATVLYKNSVDAKPKLYLVTIGINDYKNPKYKLNYAVADADGVNENVKKFSNGLFHEVVPYVIRNDQAIKNNIHTALNEIKEKALEQDVLVFYYAGHGVMATDNAAEEFYIVPHDVTQLYGSSQLSEKAIPASYLKEFAQTVNAQKQFFILDACQSSGAIEGFAHRGVAEEKAIAQLARSTGSFWLASTGTDQYASEFDKLGHGLFTWLLMDGIQGKADADNDQKLTVRELVTYIENKVPLLSEELKGTSQYPSAYSFGNDFPIVVYEK